MLAEIAQVEKLGRLAILRRWCWKQRAGSNPVLGTSLYEALSGGALVGSG